MIEHNTRKNFLVIIYCYLVYLVILTFFEKPINYDFNQCTNSTNSTNNTNYINSTNSTTGLCPCQNILGQIEIFNIATLFFGFLSFIFLLVVFNYMFEKKHFINISILLLTLYIIIVEVIGIPVLAQTVLKDCSDKIYEENHLYFFGFVSHVVIVFVFAMVIICEKSKIENILDCSICVTHNYNRNTNNDEENISIVNEDKPPPYYQ